MRTAEVIRKTKETDIAISINLDGEGVSRISTGIPFMDHMGSRCSQNTERSIWTFRSRGISKSTVTTRWRIPGSPSERRSLTRSGTRPESPATGR